MTGYADFIADKSQDRTADGFAPGPLLDGMFPFQSALVEWATWRAPTPKFPRVRCTHTCCAASRSTSTPRNAG